MRGLHVLTYWQLFTTLLDWGYSVAGWNLIAAKAGDRAESKLLQLQ